MTVDEVRAKVQRLITEILGSVEIDADGDFVIRYESTRGYVMVTDWGDGDTLVKLEALLALEVPESPELFEWLAKSAGSFYFGKPEYLASEDGDKNVLLFSHVLYGNTLDREELEHAIFGVMKTANDLDDEVVQQFGGRRAID